MFLDLTNDQAALLSTVSTILARAGKPALDGRKASFDTRLDAELEANGVLDAAAYPEFGLSTAAMVVHEVSRSASITEVAASALIRPLVCPDAPRPLVVAHGDPARPIRLLPVASAVLWLSDAGACWFPVSADDIEIVDAYFAYPVGRLHAPEACLARARACADPALARRLAHLAIAAEISGVLQGGLESVIAHVTDRQQFGRPLGAFQAVQHRLATCASTIAAAKWMTLKAGSGGDAQMAAAYAQDAVDRVAYDLHQFMGAMGLTLEHPLYRWTYRAKLLKSESGGASRGYRELAEAAWA